MPREHGAQLRRALLGQARSRRVLRARCAHDGPDPLGEGGVEPVDRHALLVDRDGHGAVPAETHGVDAREEARVLERDGVVARQRLGEQSLDGVGGAAGDRDAAIGSGRPSLIQP